MESTEELQQHVGHKRRAWGAHVFLSSFWRGKERGMKLRPLSILYVCLLSSLVHMSKRDWLVLVWLGGCWLSHYGTRNQSQYLLLMTRPCHRLPGPGCEKCWLLSPSACEQEVRYDRGPGGAHTGPTEVDRGTPKPPPSLGSPSNCPDSIILFLCFQFVFYLLLGLCHMACVISVPWLGIEPKSPVLEAQSLHHQATRKVPGSVIFEWSSLTVFFLSSLNSPFSPSYPLLWFGWRLREIPEIKKKIIK